MNARTQGRGFSRVRHWLTPVALVALIVAVVMPEVTLPRDTFNYIVTFDITQSMDVEDVSQNGVPMSRLKFAQAAMRDALGKLPCGSKIGWSVFTGQRTLLLLPPIEVCNNYDALLVSLDGIDGRMRWTNWSRIAEGGVYSAMRVAQDVGHDAAVVFVTDGQEAPPVSPTRALMPNINPAHINGCNSTLGHARAQVRHRWAKMGEGSKAQDGASRGDGRWVSTLSIGTIGTINRIVSRDNSLLPTHPAA